METKMTKKERTAMINKLLALPPSMLADLALVGIKAQKTGELTANKCFQRR